MTKILITGANSFVGKNFIKYSHHKSIDEISLIENKPEDIDFSKYNVVIHLVAIVHQSKKISEKEYFKVNKDLCVRTAKEAKKAGVKQFVFLSSVKVYGEYIHGTGPWNENSVCKPDDSYGKSKFAAEQELLKLDDENFIVSIVRPPLVYGGNVKANMLKIIRLVDRFPILPLGKVNNKRSYTSVENLVAYIDRIIEKKASGIFIAKDEKVIATNELVYLISKHLNKKIILIQLPKVIIKLGAFFYPRIFDRLYGSYEMENKKTLDQLDFKPPYTVEEGIAKMIEAYKIHKWE